MNKEGYIPSSANKGAFHVKLIKILTVMFAVLVMLVSCREVEPETTAEADPHTDSIYTETDEPKSEDASADGVDTADTPDISDTDTDSLTDSSEPESTTVSSEPESETLPESSETVKQTQPETTTPPTSATEPVYVEPQPTLYTPRAMMYHLIREDVYSVYEALFVRPAEFESHLILLNELGYEYIFADEWRLTEKPSVILTLDDGYLDNYTNMFPLIKKYNAKVTIFLVTDLIDTDGYMTSDMIREMAASGLVSFQCHTVSHLDLRYLDEARLRQEFSKSNEIIEGLTGKKVTALAYPGGGYNSTVLAVAGEYFNYAYTTKSPYSVKQYTDLTVPRYYVARGDGRNQFYNNLK